jgi:hypothetical protein
MKLISYLISTALAIWAVVGSIFCDYNLNFTITAITKGKEMKKFKVDLKLLQHDEIKIPGRYTCPSNTCFNGEGLYSSRTKNMEKDPKCGWIDRQTEELLSIWEETRLVAYSQFQYQPRTSWTFYHGRSEHFSF